MASEPKTLQQAILHFSDPVNCREYLVARRWPNGVSSYEVSRDIEVSQKSAWHMLHRIRLAMQDDLTGGMLNGEVEVDETFIGGKMRNMHRKRKNELQKEGRRAGKTIVIGVLERKGRVRATIAPDRTASVIQELETLIVELTALVYARASSIQALLQKTSALPNSVLA